jgi:AraC-like DNA-binding protein
MNPFDEIVGEMSVESSLYARFQLRAPWGIRFTTGDQARLLIVSGGTCWLVTDGTNAPVPLASGTCMILKAGVEFILVDAPGRDIVRCETLIDAHDGGLVEHGGEGEMIELVSGRFSFDPVAAEPLVSLMPDLFYTRMEQGHADLLTGTLRLMGLETARGELGAGLVVDRLGDALFIQALRAFCREHGAGAGGSWIAGLADRRLQRAIRAIHADLQRPWTVEEMAREAGLSRSSFAANFRTVVGEAPLDYLTGWRMYRAKVLLASSDENLVHIANLVGYESEVSFSRTFSRRVGVSPGRWRQEMHKRPAASDARRAKPHPGWQEQMQVPAE